MTLAFGHDVLQPAAGAAAWLVFYATTHAQ
jgi:hypothetical protein